MARDGLPNRRLALSGNGDSWSGIARSGITELQFPGSALMENKDHFLRYTVLGAVILVAVLGVVVRLSG